MSNPRPLPIFASLMLLAAACESTPTVIPTKNLDRPTDMTFVCLGVVGTNAEGAAVLSGREMAACHPRRDVDPSVVDDSGQRVLGTFAFITNAGRGELAVADMDRGRLLDLTPLAPGYGMLPIGGEPAVISASQDGCWVATANRTSCDFTLIEPAQLLAGNFRAGVVPAVDTGTAGFMRRLVVHTGVPTGTGRMAPGRELHTSTGEIAFLPPAQPATSCQPDVTPRAVATFPGCDLVALLDLSFQDGTATITSSYYVRPDGAVAAGSEPVCPEECGGASTASVACEARDGEGIDGGGAHGGGVDGGSVTGMDGGAASCNLHLQALALVPDGTRVYVAGLHDQAITSFDIAESGLANPVGVELAENAGGVSRLRLGVDPYLTGQVARPDGSTRSVAGQFLRDRGAFLYAFAADDSIRVLNLDGATPVECDVNVLAPPAQRAQGCFPVGTPGRRPLAIGPGIRIPTFTYPDSSPPLPRDIAFVDLQPSPDSTAYQALSGQFGLVLASNGYVYVINLAPNGEDGATPPPATSCTTHLPAEAGYLPAVATHSFREARDVGQCARTELAVSIAPQRMIVQADQAFATTATLSAIEGPLIKPFSADGTTTGWFDFPDPNSVISKRWDVVWEGVLPGTARVSGVVASAGEAQSAGMLLDQGANFCASAVQPGDVLMFSGCSKDIECQPDDEFSCQVSVSGARGMCLPIDSAISTNLINSCSRFMGSRMRYEVAQSTPTALSLRLKLDEVPKTSLNPCELASDCQIDAEHRDFECVEVRPQEPRCVQPCSNDSECRVGHVCERVPWVVPSGGTFCVEAPPIDADCFQQPMTAYSVRAGHSFLVAGSSLPTLHNGRVDTDGTCRYAASTDPSLVDRIPLSAPRCPDGFFAPLTTIDPMTGKPISFVQQLSALPGSNPCLYQGAYSDGESASAGGSERVRAFFQNPQIRFVMTNLDRYAGDLLSIHFELQYGFSPLVAQAPYDALVTMGTRILVGPTKTPESPLRNSTGDTNFPYLYVVDQGTTYIAPGSRGQVLRINPRAGSSEILTFDTTQSGSTPFQLQ